MVEEEQSVEVEDADTEVDWSSGPSDIGSGSVWGDDDDDVELVD